MVHSGFRFPSADDDCETACNARARGPADQLADAAAGVRACTFDCKQMRTKRETDESNISTYHRDRSHSTALLSAKLSLRSPSVAVGPALIITGEVGWKTHGHP